MVGVLSKSFDGLIYQDTCESYPNGWTFAKGGTILPDGDAALYQPAHAGTYAVRLKSTAYKADPPDHLWMYDDYLKLTKTIDVKSDRPSGTRQVRLFRGKHWGRVNSDNDILLPYDEFEGSSLNLSKWDYTGTVSVSNDQVHITGNGSEIRSDTRWSINDYQRSRCFSAKFDPKNWFDWWLKDSDNDYWRLYWYTDGHLVVYARINGQAAQQQDLGNQTGDHIWSLHITRYGSDSKTGTATLYKDGAKLADLNIGITYGPTGNLQCILRTVDAVQHDVDWFTETTCPMEYKQSFKIGSQTVFDDDVSYGLVSPTKPDNNNYWTKGWAAVTGTGSQELELKMRNANSRTYPQWWCANHSTWHPGEGIQIALPHDDILIMYDDDIIIKSLSGGQKVELYDSGGSLRRSATCPQTGQDIRLLITDLFSTALGFYGYMKVYDTNGTTLLYTTSTVYLFGGDEWTWVPNTTKIVMTADPTLIYRSGGGYSPTEATITATLTDLSTGVPLTGKTIHWTPFLGTVNPTSSDTDDYGQATTTFSAGTAPGLGGVRGEFSGDSNYGASLEQQLIDIYYAPITPDASKDFQTWVVGQEAVVASGNYKLSSEFRPQPFSFTTPTMSLSAGGWWAIEIYRKGIKEFSGRIFGRTREGGANPQLTLTGVSEHITLQRRVTNRTYTDEPKLIIEDLLARYPCGITAGSIALYGASIKLEAVYENLFDALMQIAKSTGWKFRLNANKTLDFAATFGETKDISIILGVNAVKTSHIEDWSQIDTKVYVIGKSAGATLVSVKEDSGVQMTYGLIEEPFLEKNISEQGTLDLRAEEILNQRKEMTEIITADWTDMLESNSYAPHDSVTVIDTETGLTGLYVVKVIARDLTDANKASLELSNRLASFPDVLQLIRKDVKDIGVI